MNQKSKPVPDSWTVLSMLEWATDYFTTHHIDQPRLSIEWLLAEVLGIPRLNLYLQFDRPLTSLELDTLRPMVKRRAAHEPLQYISGKAAFMSRDFSVNPFVLIPRPETEELTAMILKEHPGRVVDGDGMRLEEEVGSMSEERGVAFDSDSFLDIDSFTVLDIGTGSGCIITTLAAERPSWHCFGLDISEDALVVARQNAEAYQADVHFLMGDLVELGGSAELAESAELGGSAELSGSSGPDLPSQFDLIVSNPPYIHPDEAGEMDRQVLDFEPKTALFAENPLAVYDAIIRYAAKTLTGKGQLYLELNAQLSDQILALSLEYFQQAELRKDDAGKNRFLVAKK